MTRNLALAGSILGLAAGFLLAAFRFGWTALQERTANDPLPPSGLELVDGLAFLLVFLVPFVLCLYALRFKQPAWQAAVWLGISILAFFFATTTFSLVGLVVMPIPALLLGAAGILAFQEAGAGQALPVLGLAAALLIVGGAAFLALFSQENPVCWAQIQGESRGLIWEQRPVTQQSPNLPADPGPGDPVGWSCTSDVISTTESLTSMGLWLLALLALAMIGPRWRSSSPAVNTA